MSYVSAAAFAFTVTFIFQLFAGISLEKQMNAVYLFCFSGTREFCFAKK